MTQLGVHVFDSNQHSLLCLQTTDGDKLSSPTDKDECSALFDAPPLSVTEVENADEHTAYHHKSRSRHSPKLPASCQTVSGSRRRRSSGSSNPKPSQGGHPKAVVRLVTACKLPARAGKVLQARARQIMSSSPHIFEPHNRLCNGTVDIANSLLLPSDKGQLCLPVYNFAESPTWLRRGQILGWMQPADEKGIVLQGLRLNQHVLCIVFSTTSYQLLVEFIKLRMRAYITSNNKPAFSLFNSLSKMLSVESDSPRKALRPKRWWRL